MRSFLPSGGRIIEGRFPFVNANLRHPRDQGAWGQRGEFRGRSAIDCLAECNDLRPASIMAAQEYKRAATKLVAARSDARIHL